MIFSLIYGKISAKVSSSKVTTIAGLIATLSVLFFLINIYRKEDFYLIVYFILLGAAFSFFITANNNFVMLQATGENSGAIAGLHRMTGRFGMLFGVVIFEFLFTRSGKYLFDGYITTYVVAFLICIFTTVFSAKCLDFIREKGG